MKQPNDTPENPRMPLTRRNYILLAAGFGIILLGFVLMAGGGSDSPDEFNYAMFSAASIRPTNSTTPCSRGAASRWPPSSSSAASRWRHTPF